jgi:hypothetical protein
MLILRRDADLENRQHPLDQDAKPVDALPEIGVTKRQDTSRDEDLGPPPSSADTTRRIVSASISRSKRTRRPPISSISIPETGRSTIIVGVAGPGGSSSV